MLAPFGPAVAWAGPLQPEHVSMKTIVRSDRAHRRVEKRLSMGDARAARSFLLR